MRNEKRHEIRMMDRINIKNLEVFCRHGVYPEETVLGQKFLVDARLFLNTRKAGRTDRLSDSVSYGEVCRCLRDEMTRQNDKLLERAAQRLAEAVLLQFPLISKLEIEVKKPWAPVMMHLDYASVRIERGWHKVFVGAGSNLGDRQAYLEYGMERIKKHPEVRRLTMAKMMETEPYGYLEQGPFLNTVFAFETLLEPEELLAFLQEVESEAKRTRKIHWGPRTLDLDILLFDDMVTDTSSLVIPHPELEKRMFVLEPLCELYPYGVHPLSGKRFCVIKKELKEKLERI